MGYIFTFLLMVISNVTYASPVADLALHLNSFTTMTASFDQRLYTGKKSPAKVTRGKMALQRPGKFIWETSYPNQQKVIANNQVAWVYDVDLEQATKQNLDANNFDTPAAFLTGDIKQLTKHYIIHEQGQDFILRARKPDHMFQKFTLYFDGNILKRMDIHTRMDQTTRFDFRDVKLNPVLPHNLFVFKPPKGVDVLENR